jgi:4'-phosphopantetheinyl transferase
MGITSNAFLKQSQWGTDLRWPVPPVAEPKLDWNEIHLWCAPLDEFITAVPEFCGVLSHDECTRAGRFQFRKDGDSFVIRGGLLRYLLSRYLPVSPLEHEFIRGPNGKPELVATQGAARLYFNMSHSSSMALYAFSRAAAVGVDIERIRPMEDLDNIARNFFTPRETATLRALPDASRLEAFFNCWTRKEAILKATGQGIKEGVDGVEVTVAPNEPARVLSMKDDARAAIGWSLHALQPADGYAAALAYPGLELKIVCHGFHSLMLGKELSASLTFSVE